MAPKRAVWFIAAFIGLMSGSCACAQGVTTTNVQGTVYLATGQPGAGTLVVKWPAFTTATGEAIAADSVTAQIGSDGFVSVSLAPNQGSTPAGLYYTAVYYMSDGSTNTEYWVVPAAAQATLAQVRAQVMPAAQAVQAVTKSYVDQQVAELSEGMLSASGGNLNGPLYLSGDPTQALEAADKHYVDSQVGNAVPLAGGAMTGALLLNGDPSQDLQAADKRYVDTTAASIWPGTVLRADQFSGTDFGAKLQACLNAISTTYGGACDARNFSGNLAMAATVTIPAANTNVLLPCATITTASQIVVPAGVRNVALHGCAQRGGSAASGSTGGTAFAYSGASALLQIGDPTYAADTPGFHMDNIVIDTTPASSAAAQGLAAYRTQELDVEGVYFLGNADQTGITLDGTGNYTAGTFLDDQFVGFQTAVFGIGHQTANPATTDWLNASTFVRLHIDCPTANGAPIAGTYGINLQQGDGNTFTGGDVENCSTALHLGPNAQNNTIVGLRNENSTAQVVADTGSAYNDWITGGTMFTGKLVDNGTRNSFLDTFHRSFNALNGDWYGSQQDATLTNHYRLGTGVGNERGLLNRYQTDFGYRWTMGLSDATGGEQFYQILDELNNVYRFSVGQYNSGQSSTNDQTVVNAAGTGAVVLNGSNNAGTGGVVIGSGGPSSTTVATISNAGNAQFNGALQVGGTSQSTGTVTVRNNADSEVDYYLWPGLTASQKGSFTYKDFNGNSQWFMVKDQNNNWALNSAVGGLDSFKAYQSTNSGDTYINASNSAGIVRVNYESGSGSSFKVYGGNSGTLYASFTGANAIAFPGLAASSGSNCLQIDSSGYVTNTGAACGSGGSGSVSAGSTGQIAYYTANGTSIGGTSTVPLTAGGTGAVTASAALQNLGALPQAGGTMSGPLNGTSANFSSTVAASATISSGPPLLDPRHPSFAGGAIIDGTTNHPIDAALQAALHSCPASGCEILMPCSPNACFWQDPPAMSWTGIGGALINGPITLLVQGNLMAGTTISRKGVNLNIVGIGGSTAASFQAPGRTAELSLADASGRACAGTLGTAVNQGTVSATYGSTAVVGTGTAWTTAMNGGPLVINDYPYTVATVTDATHLTLAGNFTQSTAAGLPYGGYPQTFTPSSMGCMAAGGNISVGGPTTCSISSITRSNNQVTATLAGSCHIPPNTGLSVSGVADSTFNGSYNPNTSQPKPFFVINGDWVNNTLTWNQAGANGSSSGGAVTGFNEDTAETDVITGCASNSCTGIFYKQHSANDSYQVAVLGGAQSTANNQCGIGDGQSLTQDINVNGEIWLPQDYRSVLRNVSALANTDANFGFHTAIETGFSAFLTFDNVDTNGVGPWGIRMTGPFMEGCSGPGTGSTLIENSAISNGIKMDHGSAGLIVKKTFVEETGRALLTVDPATAGWSYANPNVIEIENSGMQDNAEGDVSCILNLTTPLYPNTSNANNVPALTLNGTSSNTGCYFNDWYTASLPQVTVQNPPGNTFQFGQNKQFGVVGTYNNGQFREGENRGEQAGLAPAVIPYQTAAVNTNPSSWSLSGCTLNTGDMAPDGSTTAGQLTGSGNAQVLSYSITPSAGDQILFGGWDYSSTPGTSDAVANGYPFMIDNFGSSHFSFAGGRQQASASSSGIGDDWWHPTVAYAQIGSADGTGGYIRMFQFCDARRTMHYWQPFFIYIPASASIPQREVLRWRAQLLHGTVPSNWNKPGVVVSLEPTASLPPAATLTGTSGTATCSQGMQGTQKYASCYLNGYAQTGTAQTYTFPTAYSTTPILMESGGSCGTYNPSVSSTTLTLPANAGMTAETCNVAVLGQ